MKRASASVNPKQDVLLAYLCGNEVSQSFQRSLLDLIGYDMHRGQRLHSWAAVRSGTMGIPGGRNSMCELLLKGDADWLFMVDSDMGFGNDVLENLLLTADPVKRPVVGALCFALREHGNDGLGGQYTFPQPTILTWQDHDDGIQRFTGVSHYPVNKAVQVGATGGACILIHRSVIERIGGDWFTQLPAPGDTTLQGEDISFCFRCKELGIPIWVHTGIRTTHFKHIWLAESDFWQSRVPLPATERVDVIIPALHRPQNVKPLMDSLRASTGLATAWWVCEPDDHEQINMVITNGGNVIVEPGSFAHKVNTAYERDGWNLDGPSPPAPWILLVGDDVRFRPGWLDQALDVANRWNADVVGTNDLLNPRVLRGEHATHMLIRRTYIDERGASWDGPGVVCHEGYHHQYVDDEIVWTAKLRGVFQAALGSHVEHVHPLNGSTPMDEIYVLGQSHTKGDKALFDRRLRSALSAGTPHLLVASG